MARRKTKTDRTLDALYASKNLAEAAAPRLMEKAIARFEKRLDEPCHKCLGKGTLSAELPKPEGTPADVPAEVITVDCPGCGGDGKGAGLEKEDIMFLRFLQGASLHKERLIEDLGLNPKQLTGGSKNPILAIMAGGNVDVKTMTAEEMETFLIEMAGGGKKKPAPVIDVKPVEPGSAPG